MIDKLLTDKKAIVFRGFGISAGQLDGAADLLLRNRLAYVHGNSPRTKVGNNIYTSTVLVAHGRRPFTGSRRVLVAMSD
jgi:hypothetical protein